jgi:DNA-binding NtrC family response regulator
MGLTRLERLFFNLKMWISLSIKILIAEDEEDIALVYEKALQTRKHEVAITFNGEDSLKTYHDRIHI